ncbi:MAG TPA: ABC transporter permease subunit [Thermoanaerobaculia bacterium]|nr:ABC transporter permease subunit [Thermoanaerobaculia bacterium]
MSTAARPSRTARRRFVADRVARWLVTAGGLGIIASILSILVFIVVEVWPLTRAARVASRPEINLRGLDFGALITDEYRELLAGLTRDGRLVVLRAADGEVVLERRLDAALPPPAPGQGAGPAPFGIAAIAASEDGTHLAAATTDGRVVSWPLAWQVTFEGTERRVGAEALTPVVFPLDPEGRPIETASVEVDEDGRGGAVALLADGRIALMRREVQTNFMTGAVTESFESHFLATPERPSRLLIDRDLRNVYGGTASGKVLWWDLAAEEGTPPQEVATLSGAVTALALLIGDRSLVVGQASGGLSVWFQVRGADDAFRLTRIREFPAHPGAIELVAPSLRNKGFLAIGGGRVGLYHSTAHRVMWTGPPPFARPTALTLAPRADGAFFAEAGRLATLAIDNPHPETTWKALFGKVWYEGYEKPEYVWQSTGGSDDFEPKFSLTPLLIGTLKGTFYSLLLAIPLGVLGAMFTSQFLHPAYQRWVKPTVEIMAALPTVVLGFLAGLWLAPRLEQYFPALLLMVVAVPLSVLTAGWLWHRLPRRVHDRFLSGVEALFYVGVLALTMWLCVALSEPLELALFGGSFPRWVLETTGLTYDQRNAVVVGLAMGFAVIPIIFAISEDAFSNVPRNLVSGSLALGANRWQTVTRVVLPTASPGIFSAIMVGFGRAVGETMIVLMATGNTPIMDWSPFNGFRTLSANIAVEIPEAPIGGTLYRALFLAALLLFALTFVVNTVAEVVRQRLRQRYSQL